MAPRFVFGVSVLTLLLMACTPLASPRLPTVAGAFDFNWRLRGDRQVGPVQVFDNGKWLWIQFAPHQVLPAVFGHNAAGEQALTLQQRGQFYVVSGEWDRLVFRTGNTTAQAYRGHLEALSADTPLVSLTHADEPSTQALAVDAPTDFPRSSNPAALVSTQALPVLDVPPAYVVQPDDRTLRQALERWAAQAGWIFEAEHWSVDIDYPISATARFELGFQEAVQALLASTEMAEQPLQPCFYQNQVLRVISWVQVCEHTVMSMRQAS